MKILVVELFDHEQYLNTFAQVLKATGNQVVFALGSRIARLFEPMVGEEREAFSYLIQEEHESVFDFVLRTKRIIQTESFDVMYVNSIEGNYLSLLPLITMKFAGKRLITLNQLNIWFEPNYRTSWKNILRNLIRAYILTRVSGVNVDSPKFEERVRSRYRYKGTITTLPFMYYDPKLIDGEAGGPNVTVVVPGGVDNRRRNYPLLLEVLGRVMGNHKSVELVLLGKCYSDVEVNMVKAFADEHNLRFFLEYLDEKTYHEHMLRADIIIAPTERTFVTEGTVEHYGTSKESGASFNIMKYAFPAIVPDYIETYPGFESSVLKYKGLADLQLLLERILSHPAYLQELRIKARQNSKNYDLGSLGKKFLIDLAGPNTEAQ